MNNTAGGRKKAKKNNINKKAEWDQLCFCDSFIQTVYAKVTLVKEEESGFGPQVVNRTSLVGENFLLIPHQVVISFCQVIFSVASRGVCVFFPINSHQLVLFFSIVIMVIIAIFVVVIFFFYLSTTNTTEEPLL